MSSYGRDLVTGARESWMVDGGWRVQGTIYNAVLSMYAWKMPDMCLNVAEFFDGVYHVCDSFLMFVGDECSAELRYPTDLRPNG